MLFSFVNSSCLQEYCGPSFSLCGVVPPLNPSVSRLRCAPSQRFATWIFALNLHQKLRVLLAVECPNVAYVLCCYDYSLLRQVYYNPSVSSLLPIIIPTWDLGVHVCFSGFLYVKNGLPKATISARLGILIFNTSSDGTRSRWRWTSSSSNYKSHTQRASSLNNKGRPLANSMRLTMLTSFLCIQSDFTFEA